MRRRTPIFLLVAAAFAVAACDDTLPEVDQVMFAKGANCDPTKKNYAKKKNCPPLPPPPPVTVEPNFRGPRKDFVSPVRVATTSSGWLLVSDSDGGVVLAAFNRLRPELCMLIDVGDVVALGARGEGPFLLDPRIHRVVKPQPVEGLPACDEMPPPPIPEPDNPSKKPKAT